MLGSLLVADVRGPVEVGVGGGGASVVGVGVGDLEGGREEAGAEAGDGAMKPNRYRPTDSKGVRWGSHDDVPPSPRRCPLCKSEMGFSIQNLYCVYSSIAGPWLRGSLIFSCQDDECRYRDSLRFKTSQGKMFEAMWNRIKELEATMMQPKTEVERRQRRTRR